MFSVSPWWIFFGALSPRRNGEHREYIESISDQNTTWSRARLWKGVGRRRLVNSDVRPLNERAHDNAADHPVDFCLSDRARRRDLLHARDRAAGRGGTGRGSSCRVAGVGRDRSVRGLGLVADTIWLDPILPAAFLPRPFDLAYASLPRHLAGGPAVRVARAGGVPLRRGGYRPASGLPDRGDVSKVDGVCIRRSSHPRGCRDLCRYDGAGARRDASYRRPRGRRPIGA